MSKLITTQSEIDIKAKPAQIIEVLADYENYSSFVSYCDWAKVIDRKPKNGGEIIKAQLKITLNGISGVETVEIHADKAAGLFYAKQLEGKLKHLEWHVYFEEAGSVTHVISTHTFDFGVPLIGGILGRWIVGPLFVKKTEKILLESLKVYLESQKP